MDGGGGWCILTCPVFERFNPNDRIQSFTFSTLSSCPDNQNLQVPELIIHTDITLTGFSPTLTIGKVE